eukprot:1060148-Amphidinium_carterae.1
MSLRSVSAGASKNWVPDEAFMNPFEQGKDLKTKPPGPRTRPSDQCPRVRFGTRGLQTLPHSRYFKVRDRKLSGTTQ